MDLTSILLFINSLALIVVSTRLLFVAKDRDELRSKLNAMALEQRRYHWEVTELRQRQERPE